MKIGVRAHDFGRMEPEALASAIAAAGFETAQLALAKAIDGVKAIGDADAFLLERIRRAFAENGVEIGILGCYVEIGDTDRDTRLREVDKFLLGLAQAKALGAKLVGTETTLFPLSPEAQPLREAAYQGLKDSVLRMAERAEKLGVEIGIETVANHTLNTAALTRRLLDEVDSPRLHVIFDPVNLLVTQEDLRNQGELFGGFLDTVGADIAMENGVQAWRGIGRGSIDFAPVFSWLKANQPGISVFRENAVPESCGADREAIRALWQ